MQNVQIEMGRERTIGVVAPSHPRAIDTIMKLGVRLNPISGTVAIITSEMQARGRRLDCVIWVDKDRLKPELIAAVEPCLY